MTVARSVSDVLADHVTLEVECIDRRLAGQDFHPSAIAIASVAQVTHARVFVAIASVLVPFCALVAAYGVHHRRNRVAGLL